MGFQPRFTAAGPGRRIPAMRDPSDTLDAMTYADDPAETAPSIFTEPKPRQLDYRKMVRNPSLQRLHEEDMRQANLDDRYAQRRATRRATSGSGGIPGMPDPKEAFKAEKDRREKLFGEQRFQTYTDASGMLQQKTTADGKPLFHPHETEEQQDEESGRPFVEKVNEYGQRQRKFLDARIVEDPATGKLRRVHAKTGEFTVDIDPEKALEARDPSEVASAASYLKKRAEHESYSKAGDARLEAEQARIAQQRLKMEMEQMADLGNFYGDTKTRKRPLTPEERADPSTPAERLRYDDKLRQMNELEAKRLDAEERRNTHDAQAKSVSGMGISQFIKARKAGVVASEVPAIPLAQDLKTPEQFTAAEQAHTAALAELQAKQERHAAARSNLEARPLDFEQARAATAALEADERAIAAEQQRLGMAAEQLTIAQNRQIAQASAGAVRAFTEETKPTIFDAGQQADVLKTSKRLDDIDAMERGTMAAARRQFEIITGEKPSTDGLTDAEISRVMEFYDVNNRTNLAQERAFKKAAAKLEASGDTNNYIREINLLRAERAGLPQKGRLTPEQQAKFAKNREAAAEYGQQAKDAEQAAAAASAQAAVAATFANVLRSTGPDGLPRARGVLSMASRLMGMSESDLSAAASTLDKAALASHNTAVKNQQQAHIGEKGKEVSKMNLAKLALEDAGIAEIIARMKANPASAAQDEQELAHKFTEFSDRMAAADKASKEILPKLKELNRSHPGARNFLQPSASYEQQLRDWHAEADALTKDLPEDIATFTKMQAAADRPKGFWESLNLPLDKMLENIGMLGIPAALEATDALRERERRQKDPALAEMTVRPPELSRTPFLGPLMDRPHLKTMAAIAERLRAGQPLAKWEENLLGAAIAQESRPNASWGIKDGPANQYNNPATLGEVLGFAIPFAAELATIRGPMGGAKLQQGVTAATKTGFTAANKQIANFLAREGMPGLLRRASIAKLTGNVISGQTLANAGARIVGGAAAAGYITAIRSPLEISNSILRAQTAPMRLTLDEKNQIASFIDPEWRAPTDAVGKAVRGAYIENISELAGGFAMSAIGKTGSVLAKLLPPAVTAKAITAAAVARKMAARTPLPAISKWLSTKSGAAAKIAKATAFDAPAGEFVEERLAELGYLATGDADQGGVIRALGQGDIASAVDQMILEGIAFTAHGGALAIPGNIRTHLLDKAYAEKNQTTLDAIGRAAYDANLEFNETEVQAEIDKLPPAGEGGAVMDGRVAQAQYMHVGLNFAQALQNWITVTGKGDKATPMERLTASRDMAAAGNARLEFLEKLSVASAVRASADARRFARMVEVDAAVSALIPPGLSPEIDAATADMEKAKAAAAQEQASPIAAETAATVASEAIKEAADRRLGAIADLGSVQVTPEQAEASAQELAAAQQTNPLLPAAQAAAGYATAGSLDALTDAQLAALGMSRADGTVTEGKSQPGMGVTMHNGKPVFGQGLIDAIAQAFPQTAALLPRSEQAQRAYIDAIALMEEGEKEERKQAADAAAKAAEALLGREKAAKEAIAKAKAEKPAAPKPQPAATKTGETTTKPAADQPKAAEYEFHVTTAAQLSRPSEIITVTARTAKEAEDKLRAKGYPVTAGSASRGAAADAVSPEIAPVLKWITARFVAAAKEQGVKLTSEDQKLFQELAAAMASRRATINDVFKGVQFWIGDPKDIRSGGAMANVGDSPNLHLILADLRNTAAHGIPMTQYLQSAIDEETVHALARKLNVPVEQLWKTAPDDMKIMLLAIYAKKTEGDARKIIAAAKTDGWKKAFADGGVNLTGAGNAGDELFRTVVQKILRGEKFITEAHLADKTTTNWLRELASWLKKLVSAINDLGKRHPELLRHAEKVAEEVRRIEAALPKEAAPAAPVTTADIAANASGSATRSGRPQIDLGAARQRIQAATQAEKAETPAAEVAKQESPPSSPSANADILSRVSAREAAAQGLPDLLHQPAMEATPQPGLLAVRADSALGGRRQFIFGSAAAAEAFSRKLAKMQGITHGVNFVGPLGVVNVRDIAGGTTLTDATLGVRSAAPASAPAPTPAPTSEVGQQVAAAFSGMAAAADEGARRRVAGILKADGIYTLKNPAAGAAALANPKYRATQNADGTVTVTDVIDPETGAWFSEAPKPAQPKPEATHGRKEKTGQEGDSLLSETPAAKTKTPSASGQTGEGVNVPAGASPEGSGTSSFAPDSAKEVTPVLENASSVTLSDEDLAKERDAVRRRLLDEKLLDVERRFGDVHTYDSGTMARLETDRAFQHLFSQKKNSRTLEGVLMGRTEARKRGYNMASWEGAEGIPNYFFGGSREPDKVAQDMADDNILPPGSTANELWPYIEQLLTDEAGKRKRIEQYKDAKKLARIAAEREASNWMPEKTMPLAQDPDFPEIARQVRAHMGEYAIADAAETRALPLSRAAAKPLGTPYSIQDGIDAGLLEVISVKGKPHLRAAPEDRDAIAREFIAWVEQNPELDHAAAAERHGITPQELKMLARPIQAAVARGRAAAAERSEDPDWTVGEDFLGTTPLTPDELRTYQKALRVREIARVTPPAERTLRQRNELILAEAAIKSAERKLGQGSLFDEEEISGQRGGVSAPIEGEQQDFLKDLLGTAPVTAEQDAQYLELAKEPEKNREALQRMVDAAAKAAGYNVGPVWHGGTDSEIFNADRSRGVYFAKDEDTAARYGRASTYRGQPGAVRRFMLRITAPMLEQEHFDARRKAAPEQNDGVFVGGEMTPDASEEYVVFSPSQIKSADPVTYDSDGKPIPLSKRFSPQSDDIRFTTPVVGPADDPSKVRVITRNKAGAPIAVATLQNIADFNGDYAPLARALLAHEGARASLETLRMARLPVGTSRRTSFYTPATHMVSVHPDHLGNQRVLLHEILHAVTSRKLPSRLSQLKGAEYRAGLNRYIRDTNQPEATRRLAALYLRAASALRADPSLFRSTREEAIGFIALSGGRVALPPAEIAPTEKYLSGVGVKRGRDYRLEKTDGGKIAIVMRNTPATVAISENKRDITEGDQRIIMRKKVRRSPSANNYELIRRDGLPYGFANLDEFMAEAMTNESFQDLLRQIPTADGKSLWEKLIDILADFFGLRGAERTLLADVMQATLDVAATPDSSRWAGISGDVLGAERFTAPLPPMAEIAAAEQAAASETVGNFRTGNPDLARGANDSPITRAVKDVWTRTAQASPETHAQWELEGLRLVQQNPGAVGKHILDSAANESPLAPEMQKAMDILIDQEIALQRTNPSQARHDYITRLEWAASVLGRSASYSLGARQDIFLTPYDRSLRFLSNLIRTSTTAKPNPNATPSQRAKQQMADLQAMGRLKSVMASLGVSMDEITGGGVPITLAGSAAEKAALSKLSAKKQTAIKMMQALTPNADIAAATGLSMAQLKALRETEFIDAIANANRDAILAQWRRQRAQSDASDAARREAETGHAEDVVRSSPASDEPMPTEEEIREIARQMAKQMGIPEWNDMGKVVKKKVVRRKKVTADPPAAVPPPTAQPRPVPPGISPPGPAGFQGQLPIGPNLPQPGPGISPPSGPQFQGQLPIGPNLPQPGPGLSPAGRPLSQAQLPNIGPANPTGSIDPAIDAQIDEMMRRGKDSPVEVVEMMMRIDLTDSRNIVKMARAIQAATPPSLVDMGVEAMISVMYLSAVPTQTVNLFSNIGNAAWEMGVQRSGEALVNLLTGNRLPGQATFAEFKAMQKMGLSPSKMMQALREARSQSEDLADFLKAIPSVIAAASPALARGMTHAIAAFSEEYDFIEHEMLAGSQVERAKRPKMGQRGAMAHSVLEGRTQAIRGTFQIPDYVPLVGGKGIPLDAAGKKIRMPLRLLMLTDSLMKASIATMEVAAMAHRIGRSRGLSGAELEEFMQLQINTPGSDSWQMAVDRAKEMVFQKDLPDWAQAISDFRWKTWWTKILSVIFLAFFKTPFNIARAGLRKAVMAPALTAFDTYRGMVGIRTNRKMAETADQIIAMREGGMSDQEIADKLQMPVATVEDWRTARARGEVPGGLEAFFNASPKVLTRFVESATMLTLLAMIFPKAEGDDDDEQKDVLLTGTGRGGRSLTDSAVRYMRAATFGGDLVIRTKNENGEVSATPYGRFEPFATVLGILVDASRAIKAVDQGLPLPAEIAQFLRRVASQMIQKTAFQGFENLTNLTKELTEGNPERDDDLVKSFHRWAARSVSPAFLRSMLTTSDPNFRDSKNAPVLYSALPLQSLAEPRVGLNTGEDLKKAGNIVTRNLVGTAQQPTPNRIASLLTRWNRRNPEDEWARSGIKSKITFTRPDGKEVSVELTAREIHDANRDIAKMAEKYLKGLTDKQVSNPTRADVEMVKRAYESAGDVVRDRLRRAILARKPEILRP